MGNGEYKCRVILLSPSHAISDWLRRKAAVIRITDDMKTKLKHRSESRMANRCGLPSTWIVSCRPFAVVTFVDHLGRRRGPYTRHLCEGAQNADVKVGSKQLCFNMLLR